MTISTMGNMERLRRGLGLTEGASESLVSPAEGTVRVTRDRFAGCLLGLALGDALGAPHEGGPIERMLWRFIGKTRQGHMRWTDDTQMALDLAESLLADDGLDPDRLAGRFAASYRWSRGYGPAAARLLKRIARGEDWRRANRSIYPEGSFGNGGAMRAPVIGLFYCGRPDDLLDAARLSALVTHAHPLGIEGAVLVATATSLALQSIAPSEILERAGAHCEQEAYTSRLSLAATWLRSEHDQETDEVARRLGNGIAASESCVTSLYIGLRFLERSFEDMSAFVIGCGGDVDTIGAMAGAVWGAARGASSLAAKQLEGLEQRARLEALASALHERVGR